MGVGLYAKRMSWLRTAAARVHSIHVSNLSWTTSKFDLMNHFQSFGNINYAYVLFNRTTGLSKGYGFVFFKEIDAMNAALANTTHFIDGREVNVNPAHQIRQPKTSSEKPTKTQRSTETESDQE